MHICRRTMDYNRQFYQQFNNFICGVAGYIFIDFDKLWMNEKPNIMQFNEIRDKYERMLASKLSQPNVRLCLDSKKSNLVVQEC